jgi:DNA glycosylase AlkZ-like
LVAERVLTARELNRALLSRQLLLERSAVRLDRAIDRVAGLQTQYAPSGYIGLWSRLRGFQRAALTKALERGRVLQGTLMRVTIHTVSAAEYPLFAAGIRSSRRAWWLRIHKNKIEGLDMEMVAARLRRHLAQGPRKSGELRELLSDEGFPDVAWSGAGLWLDLIRVPPSGTWERRKADLYGLAEDVVGVSSPSETEGMKHLIKRYLGGFGPAPVSDIAGWAGVPPTKLSPVVERLHLRRFRDEHGRQLFDVPRAPLPGGDVPAPVRFLATWDPTLLASTRRTQILPEPYRPLVFNTKTPQSVSTFLVGGAVAGIWRYEGGRVRLEPFDTVPRIARWELENEAERLATFHDG